MYNYLKSGGCGWPRPGDDGEYIPKHDMSRQSYKYRKKADYPFRGECIEGAVSYEHVRDTIIWSPKAGLNLFMLEQVIPYNYISRWYKHTANTVLKDENVSFEEVGEYVHKLELLVKKCGLQLHSLGHGYLLEPYGIHYKTFYDEYELTDEAREDVALINGKRELYLGSPNFTQLCFSKDKARLGLVDFLVGYLEKKPYIDFLHVWLSDAAGNQCECGDCIKKRPTDFYVQMLNELDERLTQRGIETKIVFIMYIDTFWPPETVRFNNPERFIMTTAITGRDYSTPYDNTPYDKPLPPYKRNKFDFVISFPLILKFMEAWKPYFDGKKFAFEYHFYTQHFNDPGAYQMAKLLLEDIRNIGSFGFSGIMSDQTQRSFFPNGLPMKILGEGLFDTSIDFEEFAKDYFSAAYGEDSEAAREYLKGISSLFGPDKLQVLKDIVEIDTGTGAAEAKPLKPWVNSPEMQENFLKIPKYVDAFLPTIEKNLDAEDKCRQKSWKLLLYHADYCKRLAEIYYLDSVGNNDKAKEKLSEMIDVFSRIELEISTEFDLCLFKQSMDKKLETT